MHVCLLWVCNGGIIRLSGPPTKGLRHLGREPSTNEDDPSRGGGNSEPRVTGWRRGVLGADQLAQGKGWFPQGKSVFPHGKGWFPHGKGESPHGKGESPHGKT